MRSWRRGIGRLATTGMAALGVAMFSATAWAEDLMGQPTPGGLGLQPAASSLKADAISVMPNDLPRSTLDNHFRCYS